MYLVDFPKVIRGVRERAGGAGKTQVRGARENLGEGVKLRDGISHKKIVVVVVVAVVVVVVLNEHVSLLFRCYAAVPELIVFFMSKLKEQTHIKTESAIFMWFFPGAVKPANCSQLQKHLNRTKLNSSS
ncbi:hypothetical protein ElyMa_003021500 [Elysia marginata]|uniref:Uncharacterized protein n=1 Tax=Elysia marginata TaxID=1093978 RepID=A0AAV4IDY7_9GAST|nr:hypothetical protein ElyMa_003021500 [Elysia marginata]